MKLNEPGDYEPLDEVILASQVFPLSFYQNATSLISGWLHKGYVRSAEGVSDGTIPECISVLLD